MCVGSPAAVRDRGHLVRRGFALLASVIVCTLVWALPAGAHTDFDSSEPAQGETVAGPLDQITIRFTNEAEPTGEGFVVLDPELGVRQPSSLENPAVGVFVLRFDPPLSPGRVGVRWTVKAPDAHPIDGSFQFTVEASSSRGDGNRPPTTEASTTEAPRTGSPATEAPATQPPATRPPATEAPATEAARETELGEFLEAGGTTSWGRTVADAGRFLAIGGVMVALGFIVFALTVMRGTRSELHMLLRWVRRAGVIVVLGTLVDALGRIVFGAGQGLAGVLEPGAYGDVLMSSVGVALLLRLAGGVIVAGAGKVDIVAADDANDVLSSVTAHVPIGAGATQVADLPSDDRDDHAIAWRFDRVGTLAAVGFVLLLVSHTFDGHTVTEGNRVLMGAASALHVLAAAIWAGGVCALALVVRRRSRRGEPTRSLVMVTRYSVVATAALVAVVIFGVYLAVVILDGPRELWSTPWGRWFIAKTAVVAVAVVMGAHNHRVIVPALEAAEDDDATVTRLRRTLRNEVLALTGVTVLTALLVRATSTLS